MDSRLNAIYAHHSGFVRVKTWNIRRELCNDGMNPRVANSSSSNENLSFKARKRRTHVEMRLAIPTVASRRVECSGRGAFRGALSDQQPEEQDFSVENILELLVGGAFCSIPPGCPGAVLPSDASPFHTEGSATTCQADKC